MESNLNRNCNADIFIYSHIPFRCATNDHVYKIITNSKANASEFDTDLEIFRDYTGNNIAEQNLMYNEYSGLYWLWKNYPIKDYIGLNHYRRFYTNEKHEIMDNDKMPTFDNIFTKSQIILNKKFQLRMFQGLEREGEYFTNEEWYACWHNINDLYLLGEIIKDLYPEYYDGYEIMLKKKYIYPSSMFVMTYEMFDQYCEFIFNVLGEYRKRRNFNTVEDCIKYVEEHRDLYIKNEKGHGYYDVKMQARIVGYIAERALATFLMHGGEKSIEAHSTQFNWAMIPENIWKI